MKTRTAILAWLVVLVPMVAWANPVTGAPLHKVAPWLVLAFGAEVAAEVLILRWQKIWIKASVGLLTMHCFTFTGLISLLMGLQSFSVPYPIDIFIAEAAIVVVEAAIFHLASVSSARFTRRFRRCLIASGVGNLVSFLYGWAATLSLSRW